MKVKDHVKSLDVRPWRNMMGKSDAYSVPTLSTPAPHLPLITAPQVWYQKQWDGQGLK